MMVCTLHVIGRVDTCNVMDARPPLVLLVHAVETNEVLLGMTCDLQQQTSPSDLTRFHRSATWCVYHGNL